MLRWVYYVLYVVVIFACATPALAQRVYASISEAPTNLGLAYIVNPGSATDNSATTSSTIKVLLSTPIQTIYQKVKFASNPPAGSPVFVRFSVTGLSSTLLGRVTLKVHNLVNGIINISPYGGSDLLQLLGLLSYSSSSIVEAKVGGSGNNLEAVELVLSTNLLTDIDFYGAFYITPPKVQDINICPGDNVTIPVQEMPTSGYSYKWYEENGSLISAVSGGSLDLGSITQSTFRYVEAVETVSGKSYPSSRIKVNVNVVSKITPLVQLAN